jgi:hypothetical protein
MSSDRILNNYREELKYAEAAKANGYKVVTAAVAGKKLANGRSEVPIDEYIKHWEDGIAAMEAGADQEQFNY